MPATKPTTPAEFRAGLERTWQPGLSDADATTREFFQEALEILCAAFEYGGVPEARGALAEIKRLVESKREGGAR